MNYRNAIALAEQFGAECLREGASARLADLAEKQARLFVMWYEAHDQLDRFPDGIRESDIELHLREPMPIPTPLPTPFPAAVVRTRRELVEQFVGWLRGHRRSPASERK